jgi:ABC-type multidrug transport system ATPase subunit
VLGKEPGSKGHQIPGALVGYMPQEIALYNEFNTHETLHYFGLLHDMKKADIKSRSDFLIEFLDLPDRYRLIKNLRYAMKFNQFN